MTFRPERRLDPARLRDGRGNTMTEKRAAGLGRMPTVGRITLPSIRGSIQMARMQNPVFRVNPSIRVPGVTASGSLARVRRVNQRRRDGAARSNPEVSVARRGPQRVKVPTVSRVKRGPIMGGGIPAPGSVIGALGRAWMDRGRTVVPGRGPVGADRTILGGTLVYAGNYIRSIATDTGLIRPRAPRIGRRLSR